MEPKSKIKYFSESRPEILKYLPVKFKTMLDVGCSSGNFSALVKSKMDVEIWGIEINIEASENAKKHLNKVILGDIMQNISQLPIGYFDCIVFNDVLEHLYDPWEILVRIKKCLSKDGTIVASIPNVREFSNLYNLLIKNDWEYKDMGILDRTHIRFFTKKSIIRMFNSSGYSIINIEGINRNEGWKWRLLNLLTLGLIKNTGYLQFVSIAKPKYL